jgi:DNA end-binding protein Ku
VDPHSIKIPSDKKTGARELKMATTLVDQMSERWDPDRYTDEYKSALMKLIDRKIESGGKALPSPEHKSKRPTNVIDLASVLQRSLEEAGKAKAPAKSKSKSRKSSRKAA